VSKINKKIQKNHKLKRDIDFNTVLSKLMVRTKLSQFLKKWKPNWDNEKR